MALKNLMRVPYELGFCTWEIISGLLPNAVHTLWYYKWRCWRMVPEVARVIDPSTIHHHVRFKIKCEIRHIYLCDPEQFCDLVTIDFSNMGC